MNQGLPFNRLSYKCSDCNDNVNWMVPELCYTCSVKIITVEKKLNKASKWKEIFNFSLLILFTIPVYAFIRSRFGLTSMNFFALGVLYSLIIILFMSYRTKNQ
jgi:DNA-directed RNA polymerase subunit RPC12/RpoP